MRSTYQHHALKENESPLPITYQVPTVHPLGRDFLPFSIHPCCALLWLELAQVLRVLSQALWVHMCKFPCGVWNMQFPCFHSRPCFINKMKPLDGSGLRSREELKTKSR